MLVCKVMIQLVLSFADKIGTYQARFSPLVQDFLCRNKFNFSQSIHSSYRLPFRFNQEKALLQLTENYQGTKLNHLEKTKQNLN